MAANRSPFRQRLQNGENVIGSFLLSHDPNVIRVAQAAGLDVVLVDFEHGTYSVELTSPTRRCKLR
ncbi:MAG: hypothetical protein ACYCYO_06945 [Bacilli bacterium]